MRVDTEVACSLWRPERCGSEVWAWPGEASK
jgi:hypothetical protein